MKVRTGFVSNSSSSSFVVAFPHKPENAEDVKRMLFGKQEWHYAGYSWKDETDVPTQRIAENVFAKIKDAATEEQILDSIRHGWFNAYMIPDMFPGYYDNYKKTAKLDYQNEDDRKEIDRLHKEADEINADRASKIAKAFQDVNKDKFVVVMEFSDNDGEEIEEHSGIFRRVEHIITSYH